MSAEERGRSPEQTDGDGNDAEGSPERVPPKAWVTLILFAAFVTLFGTCASTFMFR